MSSRSVWAVVPVKPFARAKQRLGGTVRRSERARLARLMLEDVLDVLAACTALSGVVVVTGDPAAADIGRARGAVVRDDGGRDLNAAVQAGAELLLQNGADGMIVVASDIPLLPPALIAQLADHVARPPALALVPATRDGGTNLLALSPVRAIAPCFGPDSFARHCAAARHAGIDATVLASTEAGLDIDRPDDLVAFLSVPSATRSYAYLATLPIEARLKPLRHARAARTVCSLSPLRRGVG